MNYIAIDTKDIIKALFKLIKDLKDLKRLNSKIKPKI